MVRILRPMPIAYSETTLLRILRPKSVSGALLLGDIHASVILRA